MHWTIPKMATAMTTGSDNAIDNYSLQWKSSRSVDADVADTTDWPDDGTEESNNQVLTEGLLRTMRPNSEVLHSPD